MIYGFSEVSDVESLIKKCKTDNVAPGSFFSLPIGIAGKRVVA
jgi:hypothetical protein